MLSQIIMHILFSHHLLNNGSEVNEIIRSKAGLIHSRVKIIGCNFQSNLAINCCYFYGVHANFRGCIFKSNDCYYIVGGSYVDAYFKNCLFLDNICKLSAIYFDLEDGGWSPGIESCTFANNAGGAISIIENIWSANDWVIKDNIVVNNNGPGIFIDYSDDDNIFPQIGDEIIVSNNNVYNNIGNYGGDIIDQTGKYGNISADPKFVTGPKGDYYLSQTAAGQGVNSPCVDKGGQTAEDAGLNNYTTRIDNKPDTDVVDMGYHYPMD